MILTCLLFSIVGVTWAPGWSEPVISADDFDQWDYQRKDLIVTDGNHVHQVWGNYQGTARIGYNVVLPDGTFLVEDTLFSRDVLSAYPSCSYVPDSGIIGFWREYTPKWYSIRDHEGNIVEPPTLYSSEGWSWWLRIDSSLDSLGRVHMVWDIGPEVCYSILDPGVGEVWRDTIPDSRQQSLVLVDGNRVHIKFNGPDQWADYIQYDLDGNVTIPTVSLSEDLIDETNRCDIAVDLEGNPYLLIEEIPDGGPKKLILYKLDSETGDVLIDGLLLYNVPTGLVIESPHIMTAPSGDQFYLLWLEEEVGGGWLQHIKFAVINTSGDFVEEPYIAYDYTDEEETQLYKLAACTNQAGDVFVGWSAYFAGEEAFHIMLGWFDHDSLGVEENQLTRTADPSFSISASLSPFRESVTFTTNADPPPGQIAVYDISGRMVRSLVADPADGSFFWDGTDSSGEELPSGTYIVRGASEGRLASISVVKL